MDTNNINEPEISEVEEFINQEMKEAADFMDQELRDIDGEF